MDFTPGGEASRSLTLSVFESFFCQEHKTELLPDSQKLSLTPRLYFIKKKKHHLVRVPL